MNTISKNVSNSLDLGDSITVSDVYASRVHTARLVPISNDIQLSGNIMPDTDNVYTLGDDTHRFQSTSTDNVEVTNNSYLNQLYPASTTTKLFLNVSIVPGFNTIDIGSAVQKFRDIYALGTVTTPQISGSGAGNAITISTSGGDIGINPSGGNVALGGNIVPSTTNTYNLGSSGLQFSTSYIQQEKGPRNYRGTGFTIASVGTKLTLTTTFATALASTIDDSTFNDSSFFKFPQNGYYAITGTLVYPLLADTTAFKVGIRLYNASLVFVEDQQAAWVRVVALPGGQAHFALVVSIQNATADRVALGLAVSTGTADIYIVNGKIALLSSHT